MLTKKNLIFNATLVVLILGLFLSPIKANAATAAGTTFSSGGTAADGTSFQMRYSHFTQVRSTSSEPNDTIGGYNHYLEFEVPVEIRTTYDAYYNGDYKQKLNFYLRQSGNSLYSIVQNFTITYTPNYSIPSEQLVSTAYHSATGATTGFTIYWYLLASNFHTAAESSTEIGTFTFKFWLNSPLQELTGISLDMASEDSSGQFETGSEYDPQAGMAGAIVEALDYAFSHYSSNDFLSDVHAYLYGMDLNMYVVVQALSDIYNQNATLYNFLNNYLGSIDYQIKTTNMLIRELQGNLAIDLGRIIQLLNDLKQGSTDTEANSELDDSGNRLESAGAQMSIASPNISGELSQISDVLNDPDIVAAQGSLFGWLTNSWIVTLLVLVGVLALFRFVLFGKR